MKFVIFKGFEGFGDRLQCLLQIIQYSNITNRILVIDWSDEHWSKEKSGDFYRYFHLVNIKIMSLQSFRMLYSLLEESHIDISIIPKIWKKDIFMSPGIYIYNEDYILKNNNSIINDICNNKNLDFEETIVIYSGVKNRTFSYSIFYNHFRINNYYFEKITQHQFFINIIKKKYSILLYAFKRN